MSENNQKEKKSRQNPNLILIISILLLLVLASLVWRVYKNGLPRSGQKEKQEDRDERVVGSLKYLDCLVYFNQKGMVTKTAVYKGQRKSNKKNMKVEDLPYVEDVPLKSVRLGEKIELEDDSLIETIRVLNQALIKNKSIPDRMSCKEECLSLFYGNVEIRLGKDYLLEEKLNRMFAILPNLSDLEGILHLEDFEKNTKNIMFEKKTEETSPSENPSVSENPSPSENPPGQ